MIGDTILHLELYVVIQAMWRSSPLQGKGSKYLEQEFSMHLSLESVSRRRFAKLNILFYW